MSPLLPAAIISALALAQPVPPGSVRRGVGTERQAFDVSSADAWRVIEPRLKAVGFAVDDVDRENQALRTKWRRLPTRDAAWLPAVDLPWPYTAERIRFVVFVSPFVQPARVSVGSQIEAGRENPRGGS
jgi:hypothetical protein